MASPRASGSELGPMSTTAIDAYLVCGGRYHDIDYARLQLLALLGEQERIRTRIAEDYRDIAAIEASAFLVTYTVDVVPDDTASARLRAYVRVRPPLARAARHQLAAALREGPRLGSATRGVFAHGDASAASSSRIRRSRRIASRSPSPRIRSSRASSPFDADDELYLFGTPPTVRDPVACALVRRNAKGFTERRLESRTSRGRSCT